MLEASSVKLSLSIYPNIAECLAMPAVSSRPSPRSFRQTLVGLGIVVALSDPPDPGEARIAVSPRSSSIPILSTRPGLDKLPATAAAAPQDDETEDSESYTCVISRRGDGAMEQKWEYFAGKLESFPASSDQSPAGGEEFLSSCNLCRKKLHGLDIYMCRCRSLLT